MGVLFNLANAIKYAECLVPGSLLVELVLQESLPVSLVSAWQPLQEVTHYENVGPLEVLPCTDHA